MSRSEFDANESLADMARAQMAGTSVKEGKPVVKFVDAITKPVVGRSVWVELAEDHYNENQLKKGATILTSPVVYVSPEGDDFETRNTQYVRQP